MEFIDAHCHLNAPCFAADLPSVIERAKKAGVQGAVVVTESMVDFETTLQLAKEFNNFVYPCLGVHPVQQGRSVKLEDLDEALEFMTHHIHELTAIGEVGLLLAQLIFHS